MFPCLSQVCTLPASLEDDFDGYADAAGSAIELWLTKLEEYLAQHSLAEVSSRAADRGLRLAAASFQGGLLISQGPARAAAWEQFQRRLDLCAALQIPVLVITADFLGPFDLTDIDRAQASLHQAGTRAAAAGVRLALEFQARNTFVNNLETAVLLTQGAGHPQVGICLDLFHFFIGPSKLHDLEHLTRDNLFHVQVSDLAHRPRELATDADRIIPGDGDFRLSEVFEHLRRISYEGAVSLELLNPLLWPIPPRQLGEIGLTALRMALGQAQPR